MSIDTQPQYERFSSQPAEAKIGHDLVQITIELQQQLDTVLMLDNKRLQQKSIDPIQEEVIRENSFRLIHEYATASNIPGVMSRASIENYEEQKSRLSLVNGDEQRILLAKSIQSWLLKGQNPFDECGLIDANELIEITTDKDAVELSENDTTKFLDAMELGSQEYALSSIKNYGTLSDENIREGDAGLFDFENSVSIDQTTHNQPFGRIKKLGRRIIGAFKSKTPVVEKNENETKELSKRNKVVATIGAVAVLSVGALLMGANSPSDDSNFSSTESVSYETSTTTASSSTTVTTTTIEAPLNDAFETPEFQNVDVISEPIAPVVENVAPAPVIESEIPRSVTVIAGSNVWNTLQEVVTGSSDSKIDNNPIIEKAVTDAIIAIATENNMSVEELGRVNPGQVITLSDTVRSNLASYRTSA